MTGAAGALGWQAPDARSAAEAHGFRRQRAAQRDPRLQYDEHIADVEEQAFSKLRHNLNRLERKAEREHACYDGAAGYSTEKRVERSDWEQDGARRNRLATPRGDNDSVAALISHSPAAQRPSSPGRGRSGSPGPMRNGSPGPARGSSPGPTRPASPGRFAAPTAASQRRSAAAAVPPLQMGGGNESMAGRIASRRQQNSARRMAAEM